MRAAGGQTGFHPNSPATDVLLLEMAAEARALPLQKEKIARRGGHS
jgi:hypothetical protein